MDPFLDDQVSLPSSQSPRQSDRNATPIPLILGLILMMVSGYILWSARSNNYLDSDAHDIILRAIVYLLTPFAVVMCMIIDIVLQSRGISDAAFFARPNYSKALRVIVLISFVIAALDISTLAKVLADLW